jgi:tRNA dimethylallyltransferase
MESKKSKIIVISGATATGKTEISIEVAKRIDGEIVSADSMLIYKYMNIGTAKPTKEEMEGIPHHLIDIVEPDKTFSVKDFLELADKSILDIQKRGKTPIVVGGTWLYIQALLFGLSDAPEGNWELRKKLYKKENEELYQLLHKIDKEYAEKIHINDKKRIIRGLEVFYTTGKTFSQFQKEHKFKEKRYEFIGFNFERDRDEIMERIEKRIEKMFQKGLVEEVKSLINMGYESFITSTQAIGYKEIVPYLKGEIDLETAKNNLVKNTKSFAKRQLRTFRNKFEFENINLSNYTKGEVLDKIINNTKLEEE